MNAVATTLDKIEGIYDVYPPAIPEAGMIETALIALCILLFICFLVYIVWLKFYSLRGINKRHIKQLKKQYTNKSISSHDAIYQLCGYLKNGLAIKKFDQFTPLPEGLPNIKQWQSFAIKMTNLRYQNKNQPGRLSCKDLNVAFDDALYWLKVWPK